VEDVLDVGRVGVMKALVDAHPARNKKVVAFIFIF
jgi:hypothetical protein